MPGFWTWSDKRRREMQQPKLCPTIGQVGGRFVDDDDLRARRIASNEALGRQINERIAAQRGVESGESMSVVCECGDGDCESRLDVRWETYRAVRQNPMWFILVEGHEVLEMERVVKREGVLVVSEKIASARQALEAIDPYSADGASTGD